MPYNTISTTPSVPRLDKLYAFNTAFPLRVCVAAIRDKDLAFEGFGEAAL
jgi:hypothetical protein